MERHNVDLFATEFVDDLAHTGTAGADAGADRIDVRIVGPHGDLGAVAWFAGTGLDLHDAVGNFGDLELEEALDQTRVGAADDDLRALGRLADLDDVCLDAGIRVGAFERHLLGLGQERLDSTEVEQRVAGVGLLDHARDDVAFAAGVLLVLQLAFSLTDALGHHLAGGLCRNASEVVGGDLKLVADGLAVLVEFLSEDLELHGLGVDRHPGVFVRIGHALVGVLEGVGERPEERINGDPSVGGERLQRLHHVLVHQ